MLAHRLLPAAPHFFDQASAHRRAEEAETDGV
jgi:hypothetical protein